MSSSSTPEGKRKLLEWAKNITQNYSSVSITDFSTSWQNGMAFCAIVHYYESDLIDFESLNPDDKISNLDTAFQALRTLGIASTLDPEEIARNPDQNSIQSYLEGVRSQLKRRAANITPKLPQSFRLSIDSMDGEIQFTEEEVDGLFSPDMVVQQNVKELINYKVIMLGDPSVGKSALFERWRSDSFKLTSTTVGMELWSKVYHCEGKYIQIQLWDTAGQDIYRAVTKSYYRESMGVILVYDITKLDTFNNVSSWMKEFHEATNRKDIPILLVGNKLDINYERMVTTREANEFAKRYGFHYMETSAKDGDGCNRAFQLLFQEIHKIERQNPTTTTGNKRLSHNYHEEESPFKSDCPC